MLIVDEVVAILKTLLPDEIEVSAAFCGVFTITAKRRIRSPMERDIQEGVLNFPCIPPPNVCRYKQPTNLWEFKNNSLTLDEIERYIDSEKARKLFCSKNIKLVRDGNKYAVYHDGELAGYIKCN